MSNQNEEDGMKTNKAEQEINSMEQFQRKYYPKSVGKTCPYCGKDLTEKINKYSETIAKQPK